MTMPKNKVLFMIMFLTLALTAVGWLYFPDSKIEAAESNAKVQSKLTVVTTPVEKRFFERSLNLQGNLQTKYYADIPARLFGTLDAVFVDEGDSVKKGETRLFQVDKENLERSVKMAEQDVIVAKHSVRESEANLERIQADLDKAKLDYDRTNRLFTKNAATSDTVEQQESRYKQVVAFHKHATILIDLNKEKAKQAEIALEVARKNLSDSIVIAPIDGVVTKRLREPGEIAERAKTILRIENTSIIEISAYLPAQYYASVMAEKTEMRVKINGIDIGNHSVSYKSPTIDPKRRTFEVRCLLKDPAKEIVPGAMAEVSLMLDRHDGLGVPRDAVQIRDENSVVFTVKEGLAHLTPVQVGLINDGWIEITDNSLDEGTPVVSTGQYMLNNGSAVTIKKGGS